MTRKFLRPLVAALMLLVPGVSQTIAADGGLVVEAVLDTASYGLASGFGSIWSMQGKDLLRIDAGDNSITKIPIPESRGGIRSIAIGEDAVWLPDGDQDGGEGTIFKIDPATNAIVLTIHAPLILGEGTIGVGAGSIWIMTVGKGKAWLARYSAENGAEQAQIPLRPAGLSVLFAHDAVWVSGSYKNEVYRIDPTTNTLAATIKVPGGPRQLAASADAVWVQCPGSGDLIHRIDPATNEVVASIKTDTGIDTFASLTAGGGTVWATYHEGYLLQIDPATNAIVNRYEGGEVAGYNILHANGSLWLSGYGSTITRIAPPAP